MITKRNLLQLSIKNISIKNRVKTIIQSNNRTIAFWPKLKINMIILRLAMIPINNRD